MSMKTLLASQLKKLETPQTNLLQEHRIKVSFLYKSDEAYTIDKDTHYTICLSGFQQICKIDPSLEEFGDSLFNLMSKDFDRSLLTKEANEKLNEIVKVFLFRVISPYFMLPCTHKMLEWLIYRYSVHEFNLDHLILAVLPYHETKLFPRVVQLSAKLREPSNKWHWLIGVQKNGTPLPKASLVAHCSNHPSTIRSLMELILNAVKSQQKIPTIISFFTSTLVNVLEMDFDDNFVLIVINYLVKGLKIGDSSVTSSCYLVLSHLATRVTLKVSKLEKLLVKMAKCYQSLSNNEQNEKNFLLTLLVVYEYQETETISESVLLGINIDLLIEMLGKIESRYLLTALLTFLINDCQNNDSYLKCLSLIDNLKLGSWTILKMLEAVTKKHEEEKTSDVRQKLINIVQTLEKRYPIEFDKGLAESNLSNQEDLIVSSFYAKLNGSNVNVFEGLRHASDAIRFHSAAHIAKNHKEILKCTNDEQKEKIAAALTNTWNENNPSVLIELLSCRDLFIKMVPLSDLIDYGKKLLPRCIEMIGKGQDSNYDDKEVASDWITVRRSCFKLVSNLDFKDESQFWSLFVDYFLPLEQAGLSLFSVIFETDIEKTNKKLFAWTKTIYTEELKSFIDKEDYGSSIDWVAKKIAQHICKNPESQLLNILNQPGIENYRKRILGLCILFHLLPQSTEDYEMFNNYALTCLSFLSKLLDPSYVKFRRLSADGENYKDIKCLINSNLTPLRKKRVTGGMVQLFVSQIISNKQLPNIHTWFWHFQTPENNYLYGLFNFLCHQSHHGKQISEVFKMLLRDFMKAVESWCPKLLSGFWARTDDPLLQSRALDVTLHIIKDANFDEVELISFLLSLQSPYPAVRCIAVRILDLPAADGSLISFLKQYKELIENNEQEVAIALSNFWSDTSVSKKTLTFNGFVKYLKNLAAPSYLRLGMAKLLKDYNNVDCLKVFLDILDTHLKSVSDHSHEIELCMLSGRKILDMIPILDNPVENFKMHHLFKSLLSDARYRLRLIEHISSEYIKRFDSNVNKLFIAEILLDLVASYNERLVRRKLRKFFNDGELVSDIIEKLINDSDDGVTMLTQMKRRRLERPQIIDHNSAEWRKIVMLLEVFATVETFTGSNRLMETSFKLLKESLLAEEQASAEYFRSLLLVILSNCLNQEDVNLDNFQLVYILESLRHARLRETRMQALSIITRISPHFKNDILRDIMVIFGFIGNDMIKCDDQYTHKILDDTMDTIIPGLVTSSENSQKQVIETFTDAFNDIPVHRRLYLFIKLVNLLGEESSLWFIIFKLIQKVLYSDDQKKIILEFIRALVCNFDGITQMKALNQLMILCLDIAKTGSCEAFGEVFRFQDNSRKEIIRCHIQTILMVVSFEDYVSAVAESKWSDMEDLFRNLFETNLLLIDQCIRNENKTVNVATRLTRDLLKVLEKVNSLLPGPEFVSVIHRLLDSKAMIVRRKALELFNSRLTLRVHEKIEISMLRDFIDPIMKIVVGLRENQSDLQIVTSQTGMMSIKILAKILKSDEESIEHLKSALESIISLHEVRNDVPNKNLLASIILCIAQLVATLQTDCLSLIPSVMSIILETLIETSEILLLSCLTALIKITKYFSKFLSSNLVELVIKICSLNKESSESSMAHRIDVVVNNLATLVPFRILIQSLEEAYNQLETPNSLYTLLIILSQGLANSGKTEIEPNLAQLQKFALKLLDYRCENSEKLEPAQIDKVEEKSLEAIVSFVPKLSESSFRSFFYKIYDWAILCKDDDQHLRLITFYRLTDKLAAKLKSLFCAFAAPYIVNNCIQQLKAFHIHPDDSTTVGSSKRKIFFDENIGHLIILNILSTLAKCFQYDINSTFASKDRTNKLILPILDQMTNDFGVSGRYEERINEGVVKCLNYLVKAVNDHNVVKDLNNKLLLKTRENSSKVRCQALHVLHQLILTMTEEYLPLLPEAIPFLSELYEDDSEDIQKLLLIVFSDIEKIFGEPIQSYF